MVKFEAVLQKESLELVLVPGDGNCLFRSVSQAIMNDQSHHLEYRHFVTVYMSDNPEEYAWYFESKEEQTAYVERMAKSG